MHLCGIGVKPLDVMLHTWPRRQKPKLQMVEVWEKKSMYSLSSSQSLLSSSFSWSSSSSTLFFVLEVNGKFWCSPRPALANRRSCSNCASESTSPSHPAPLLLFPSPPLASARFPSPPRREAVPLKPARGLGERCKPRSQSQFAALYARKTHLVAAFPDHFPSSTLCTRYITWTRLVLDVCSDWLCCTKGCICQISSRGVGWVRDPKGRGSWRGAASPLPPAKGSGGAL